MRSYVTHKESRNKKVGIIMDKNLKGSVPFNGCGNVEKGTDPFFRYKNKDKE